MDNYRPFTLLGPREKDPQLLFSPIFYVLKVIQLVAILGKLLFFCNKKCIIYVPKD